MTRAAEEPYAVAKGYVQSAYAMMSNPCRLQTVDDTSLFMGFHMLCGFAVELYLKAYLLHKGHSEGSLRGRNVRHDLIKLHAMCVSEGLYCSGADMLVGLLAKHHRDFSFRYMQREAIYHAADLCSVFSAFSHLDRAVDSAIGASASRGGRSSGRWDFPMDGYWRLPGAPVPGS
ncbi:hypothetical protein DU475_07170 [Rhodopseudomonas sp. WA056]|nr:hypothetical protein [Rhodopseudomonas sp. WA056]